MSSCRPSRVPSYLRTIVERKAGARLAALSYVEPRVMTQLGSAIRSRTSLMGLGVVVKMARGKSPSRSPNIS